MSHDDPTTGPPLPQGEPPPVVPKQPILAYVLALVGMTLIAMLGILALEILRPNKDNSQIIATLVSMLTPTAGVIILLIHNGAAIKEIHYSVNSRLSQFVEEAKKAARAAGVEAGRGEMVVPVPQHVPVVVDPNQEHIVVEIPKEPPTIVLIPSEEEAKRKGAASREKGKP